MELQSGEMQDGDQFSSYLLEQEVYFQSHTPIINFNQKDRQLNKKVSISGWNETNFNDAMQLSEREVRKAAKMPPQRNRIEDFLSTIRSKNGELINVRAHLPHKGKRSSIEIGHSQKSDIFLPINNTIISFPKSRSQNRRFEGEQRMILEKLYRKRQKSKVIPKEISISPNTMYGMSRTHFPVRNFLGKNRSFDDDNTMSKVYNPETKSIRECFGVRRRFSSSYYKKMTEAVKVLDGEKRSLEKDKLIPNFENNQIANHKGKKRANSSISDVNKSPVQRPFKTIQSHSKVHKLNLGHQKQFSISKVREDAKNSHLNRIKTIDKNDIQLMGSTIARWKEQAGRTLMGRQ